MSVETRQPKQYYDIDKHSPTIDLSPNAMLTQSYQSTSKTSSTVRFRVNSAGPRSLLKSSILFRFPTTFSLKHAAHAQNIVDTRSSTASADRVVNSVAQRFMGLIKATSSIVLELNSGVSLAIRPEQFAHVLERWCCDEELDEELPGGPRDSAFDGERWGRVKGIINVNASESWQSKMDEGYAARHRQFVGANQAAFTTVFETRLPLGVFTYFTRTPDKLGGRRADAYLPYINSFSVTWNFKPMREAIQSLLQCSPLINHDDSAPVVGLGYLADAEARGQIVGANPADSYTFGDCEVICNWVSPSPDIMLAPSYSFFVDRWLVYTEDVKFPAAGFAGMKEVVFRNIKMEANPLAFVLCCRPKVLIQNGTFDDYNGGDAGQRAYKNGPGGIRSSCAYQDTFSPLACDVGKERDPTSQILTLTINEKANLMSSYSLYDLYRITKTNMEGRLALTFDQWRRGDCQIVVLCPEDIPTTPSSVYNPQTFTLRVKYQLSSKLLEHAEYVHQVELMMLYGDYLSVAPGSASLSSVLFNENQLRGGTQLSQDTSKLEDMKLE